MNKNEYLSILEKELKSRNINDISEIIAEYNQHFENKKADGYGEEEIAAKLEKPQILAAQFKSPVAVDYKAAKAALISGAVVSDIFSAMFFVLLFSWLIVMSAASVAFLCTGVALIININIANLLPSMPYIGSLLMGVSLAALSFAAGVGTIYCYFFFRQLLKSYIRWHKNLLSGSALYPPLPKYPQLPPKLRRNLRSILLFSLIVFFISFILGYIIMAAIASSLEFWHVWNWFV
jgi:uncharacterized membrane protein